MNLTLRFLSEKNLTVFTPEFHILAPLPNPTQIQSLSNNLDHIFHLVSPFSLPTLFFDESALHINLVYQRIVIGSAGSFVAGETGTLVTGNAVCLVAAGGFGPGDVGNSSVVVAVCLATECTGCSSGGTEHFVVFLASHHPSPLLYFYRWGNLVSIHILFYLLRHHSGTGVAVSWVCASTFIVGVDVGAGGISQSFLNLNKFSDVDPVLHHGEPSLTGIFSSGGGLLSAEGPHCNRFSWNFPFVKFIIVIGIVTGICMVMLSALEVGACMGFCNYSYLIPSGWDQLPPFVICFCPSSE